MQKETTRKCIVTGQILDKGQLLRFTLTPDNEIVPDLKKKLPGKGVYVVNSKKALLKAISGGLFGKALKAKVKVDEGLAAQVEKVLSKQALDAVSLARKAGVGAVPGSSFFSEPVNTIIRLHFAKKDETLCDALDRLSHIKDLL